MTDARETVLKLKLTPTQRLQQAADRIIDPDRLLPGEDATTHSIDDARNWMNVYAELIEFKDILLMAVDRRVAEMSPVASREIQDLDVTMLEAQRRRYKVRLAHWEQLGRTLGVLHVLPDEVSPRA